NGDVKAQVCDGAGTCTSGAVADTCAPYACSGGSCKTSCSTNGDCSAGNACIGGECQAPLKNGVACTADGECQSKHCADTAGNHVCCDQACDGPCVSCIALYKQSGDNTGQCGPAHADTDPKAACPDPAAGLTGDAACGADGKCDGLGSCRT